VSRDGGLSWKSAKPGSYIYDIGDHGSIIVAAPKGRPTKEILYSIDEGETWETLQIAEKDIEVNNVIIEPNSISQQFIIYGTYVNTVENQNSADEKPPAEAKNVQKGVFGFAPVDSEMAKETKAFLTYIDFSAVHTRQCSGVDEAGEKDSDFELWTPYDGRHGDSKCFLGQQVTYTRRKQNALCYNGEDLERVTKRIPCACTEMDYECSYGYQRAATGGSCERINKSHQSWDKAYENIEA